MLAIVPKFFILPRDYDEFKLDLERNPSQLYIQKVSRKSMFGRHQTGYGCHI
jgi:hypothetical protein